MSKTNKEAPHNLEAEDAVLGAMLLSASAISEVITIVDVDDFYRPSNGHIFSAIQTLYSNNEPVDPVTVSAQLEQDGLLDNVGGSVRLITLQNQVPSTKNAASYASIVREASILRRLGELGRSISSDALTAPTDAKALLSEAESALFDLGSAIDQNSAHSTEDMLLDGLERLEKVFDHDGSIIGTETGYSALDKILLGLQENAFYLLGARPSMGKSVFAVNVASHVSMRANKPVLFFSLEMGREELMQRVICSEGLIDSTRYKSGKLSKDDWVSMASVMSQINQAQLWIDDNPNLSLMDVRATAKRISAQAGKLGAIIIDYIGLMRWEGPNEQAGLSDISRNLKILARELEVPIIALSQLSRGLESRLDKRPMLSDLRSSGSLEQDADVVMFLYRDEAYNEESDDKGIAEIIVAKHRSGPTGTVKVGFMAEHSRFVNLASA